MRDMNDTSVLKNAFGKADLGFENNLRSTLSELQLSEERRATRKVSWRAALACALVGMLLTGVVLAMSGKWGVLDFIQNRHGVAMPSEAAALLQSNPPQRGGQLDLASFAVREAVFDGRGIYLVVAVHPVTAEYLLLGVDANPADPVANLGPLFEKESGTIADYAKANKKTALHTYVRVKGMESWGVSSWSGDFILEEDGTLVYMLHGAYESNESELSLELVCATAPYLTVGNEALVDLSKQQMVSLNFALQNSGVLWNASCTEPQTFADCGVRIDRISLTGSMMAIYAKIEFTVIDAEKYAATDDGLWFEFVDASGERLQSGAAAIGSIVAVDDSGTSFVQTWSLQATQTQPEEIILRGYNRWESREYETHLFALK